MSNCIGIAEVVPRIRGKVSITLVELLAIRNLHGTQHRHATLPVPAKVRIVLLVVRATITTTKNSDLKIPSPSSARQSSLAVFVPSLEFFPPAGSFVSLP